MYNEKLNRLLKEMDVIDVIQLDVPLLTRLLEYFNETDVDDAELHFILERIIKLSKEKEYLTMEDYSYIINTEQNK